MEDQLKLRRFIVILLFISVTVTVHGQRFYAGINMGGGWAFGKSVVGLRGSSSTAWATDGQYWKTASFAEGLRGNLTFGYRPDTTSFFELGIHSWKHDPISWKFDVYRFDPAGTPYSRFTYTLNSGHLFFSLSYGLNYRISRNFSWFAKAGAMAGKTWIWGSSRTITRDSSYLPIREYYSEYDYTTRFSIGGIAGIGVKYRVSERIAITGEGFVQVMQTSVRSRDVTLYKEDGVDKTNELREDIRHTDYYNGRRTRSSDSIEKNQSLSFSQNALSFNLGLLYSF